MSKSSIFITTTITLFFACANFVNCEQKKWETYWDELHNQRILIKREENTTRLKLARILAVKLSDIIDGKIEITDEQKSKLDLLISEFRDELFLIEQEEKTNLLDKKIKLLKSAWSGLLLFRTEQISNHPEQSSDAKLYQGIHLEFSPSNIIMGSFGLKTQDNAYNFSKGLSLSMDEAYIQLSQNPFQFSVGRIYFILDRLGLIADNYFDAFEGVKFDYSIPISNVSFTTVYSRLSSTNYPYKSFIVSSDEYWAFRVSGIKEKETEIGLTYLASGIASETGGSIDFHTQIGVRELTGEVALYRASKTDYTATRNTRVACVLGFDVVRSRNKTIFLQLGSVEKGFTPMASSLIYSAGNHLYFDQNTVGYDITFSYRPEMIYEKESKYIWDTRFNERKFSFPKIVNWEFEVAGLFKQDSSPYSHQYIFRHTRSIIQSLSIYFENILWDRKNTILYPYSRYNQMRMILSLNF